MDKQESVCGEADRLVSGDRNAYYGHALDDFSKTALFWSAILGIQVTPEQVAMCMEAVKMSREINRHKRDNLVDLCGYAKCHELVIAEKERRFKEGWVFNAATARWTPPEPNSVPLIAQERPKESKVGSIGASEICCGKQH